MKLLKLVIPLHKSKLKLNATQRFFVTSMKTHLIIKNSILTIYAILKMRIFKNTDLVMDQILSMTSMHNSTA